MMNMLTVSAGCITRHYDPSQHTSVMKNKNKNKNKELWRTTQAPETALLARYVHILVAGKIPCVTSWFLVQL